MAHVFTVYKTETCPYCHNAVQFLDALRSQRPDVEVKLVDAHASPQRFRRVAQQVGRSTVPQIFLDDQYVGGWDDLARAAGRGQLDAYLDGGTWEAPARRRRSWWPFGRRADGQ